MIPDYLPPLVNHLWQSTLFAVAAGLLTLALRRNRASIRYRLWLAASIKFLIPFSLLESIGSHVEWRTVHTIAPPELPPVLEQVSRPFVAPLSLPSNHPASLLPVFLLVTWTCGFVAVLFYHWLHWRRIHAIKRQATPMVLSIGVKVMSSPAVLEPAVFGIFRPVLLLPDGILGHLRPRQLDAIIAHELCHIRRRDNLAAALHMAVEAIFWFHPVVWWLGTRLIEERERACDEAVL